MGRIPTSGQWVRLEVPASYVGLEGKSVRGMAFGMYQQDQKGRAVWDYSGKTSNPPAASMRPLTFTSPMYRIRCTDGGRFHQYSTVKDKQFLFFLGCQQQSEVSGYVYSYPTPGSIPLHEWKASGGSKRLYNTCLSCITGSWVYQGVVGYVIPGVLDPTVSAPWKVFNCSNIFYYDVNPPTGCTNLNFNAGPIHSTAGFAAPYGN
jgi:hypothetical protein